MTQAARVPHPSKRSNADISTFLQASADLIIEHDASLRCVAANPATVDLLGIPATEWIGQLSPTWLKQQTNHPARAFIQQLIAGLQPLLSRGESKPQVYELVTEQGPRWFDFRHTPMRDRTGATTRILSIGRDVTAYHQQQQQTEQVLRRSQMRLLSLLGNLRQAYQNQNRLQHQEALLQSVLDALPYCVFWKDHHSVYQGCNRNWATIVGLVSPQAIVGKTDEDFCWSKADAASYRALDQEVITSGQSQINVLTSRRQSNGEQLWFNGTKLPIHSSNGTVIGILCMFQPITKQQRATTLNTSAELLQTVLDNIPQALFWKDRNLVYLGCNRNWARTAGFDNLADVVGKTDYDLIWNEEAELYRTQDRQVMETDTPVLHLIEHRINADGQETWIDVNKIPIHDAEDNVIGILGTIEDITERKLAEIALQKSESRLRQQTEQLEKTLRELQQTQAQLVQTEKMSSLGQLVAGIAHEINNPVNFIYGNVNHAHTYMEDLLRLLQVYQQAYPQPVPAVQTEIEAMDLEFVLEDLPKLLSSMKVGAERIQTIVLALRNFSRMDEAEVKQVDIHEGIDSTLMILHNRLKARADGWGIQVVKEYGTLPPVECYAGQLNQVFMNIIANAIDALEEHHHRSASTAIASPNSSPGTPTSPTITIRTEVLPNQRVAIRITDNGPGMSTGVHSRLFDPFFTTKPVGKGTGLGLAISYQIVVERHQGNLQCLSAVGEGTTFQIEIPIAPTTTAQP